MSARVLGLAAFFGCLAMLAADKQLLDAQLHNELQELRRLEITNIVNRFQSALTPATLIAGFCFASISEVDIIETENVGPTAKFFEPIFYICDAFSLACALYVLCVSSMGIIFGQRLTIQATHDQGRDHEKTVRELNNKFMLVLIALGLSMVSVVGGELAYPPPSHPSSHELSTCALPTYPMRALAAALSLIWVKDPTGEGAYGTEHENNWVAMASTTVVMFIMCCSFGSMGQMFCRLHTEKPTDSKLILKTTSHPNLADVSEFYVGSHGQAPANMTAAANQATKGRSDERSSLLFGKGRFGGS